MFHVNIKWSRTPKFAISNPDNMVRGANIGPIWGRQDPDGPHIGPMDFAIWEA